MQQPSGGKSAYWRAPQDDVAATCMLRRTCALLTVAVAAVACQGTSSSAGLGAAPGAGGSSGSSAGGSTAGGSNLPAGGAGAVGQPSLGFPPDHVSGTRLKARVWREGGQALVDDRNGQGGLLIWYDSELETPCVFERRDGTLACFPLGGAGDLGIAFLPVYGFGDGGCRNQRLAAPTVSAPRDAWCPAPRYATLIREGAPLITWGFDSAGLDTYELGAAVPGSTWYEKPLSGGDECGLVTDAPFTTLYPVARKLETTELVSGHVERVDTGFRLGAVVIVGDDGSRERVAWYDNQLGAECSVQLDTHGVARCVPPSTPLVPCGPLYGDGDCLVELACQDEPPPLGFLGDAGSRWAVSTDSSSEQVYYRVGTRPSAVYSLASGVCTRTVLDPSSFVTILKGSTAPLDTFGDTVRGDGRLRVAVRVDSEGATDPSPGSITDSATSEPCSLVLAAGGDVRCFPASATARYSDASCGEADRLALTSPSEPAPPYLSAWLGDPCGGGTALFERGPMLASPSRVYDTDAFGQGCTYNPYATGASNAYSFGPSVPLESFVAATLVTED